MERKLKVLSLLILSVFLLCGSAMAYTVTYEPSNSTLYNLDHRWAYEWDIDASELSYYVNTYGTSILSVSLTFEAIYDSSGDETNALWLNLVDADSAGLYSVTDSDSDIANYFEGEGLFLTSYVIDSEAATITYTFTAADIDVLLGYLSDGFFGITIDPDCYFVNEGISLTIETSPVPEPATMLLVGTGLIGIASIRRKRNKK